jgi:hypothetical protein
MIITAIDGYEFEGLLSHSSTKSPDFSGPAAAKANAPIITAPGTIRAMMS